MKPARHLFSMLLVCSGLVLAQGVSDAATIAEPSARTAITAKPDHNLVDSLRDSARGSVSVSRETATQRVDFVAAGRNGDLMPDSSARATDKARTFLDTYGPMLGASDPNQLKQVGRDTDAYGTTITYTQNYRGIPVFGAMLRAHLDEAGDLTSVNGTAIPDINVSTTPTLSAAKAGEMAVRAVRLDPPTDDAGRPGSTEGTNATTTQLTVYRTGLTFGRTGDTQLAYQVEVGNGSNIGEVLFLNAGSGKLLNRYSTIDDAMERHVYEKTFTPQAQVWQEGDDFPGTLTEDQQNIVRASGEAHQFFLNSFGRDSYDGNGAPQRTVNNDPRISCPNANWNGTTTNYCNGVTSDDVVAHEWGHAYTQFNSNLIYQWQPGALNESYSDIWGETVDLINGRMDDDEGDIDAKRPDGLCSEHSPALPQLRITSPGDIAKICATGGAAFGPAPDSTGVTGTVVRGLDDTAAPGPSTTDGCSPLTNAAAVNGNIAVIDRGGCAFTVKVKNAQDAGAIAAVIGNNVEAVNGMSGTDPTITIPSVMIKLSDRDLIVNKLSGGTAVTVLIKDATTSEKSASFRWLIGEDSSAFGGAIRDMWTPTCHGDPGKVSDAEYYCASDDAGGVHSNSGVNNHAYALLVDGGTYNGRTIDGIGLTKAAHIFWRAQTNYQTQTTDFADQANALASACEDLVGEQVDGLSVDGSPEQQGESHPTQPATIEATDCAQVSAVIEAVEFTKEPTQCNFQPLLAKNTPAVCSNSQQANTVWSEDFENGLDDWSVDSSAVNTGAPEFPWATATEDPDAEDGTAGIDGTAAYAVDAPDGQCDQSADDHSGMTTMTGPVIAVPGAKQKAPKLTFDHYMAVESGADGGNVKVSINGGPFSVVPASAYVFNKPTTILSAAQGNTNPLAGQQGFTGTDGGQVHGSWGQSQIDLTMVGVKPGDSIQLRFDFGQDGCTGLDGWYVDNVTFVTCKSKANVAISPASVVATYGQKQRLVITVSPQSGSVTPTGTVEVSEGEDTIASAALARNGTAKVLLPATLAPGAHSMVVSYSGDEATGDAAQPLRAQVAKAESKSTLTLSSSSVVKGHSVKTTITTTSIGVTPTGKVTLLSKGDQIGHGTLKNGKAVITLTKQLGVGRHTIRAEYPGSDTVRGSADTATLTVRASR